VALLHAADAGIELAAHDLARANWQAVLQGVEQATFSDGSPTGVRAVPGGGAVNLSAETNTLNCGKTSTCTTAQMNANSDERPWGVNNPRWRLYVYGAFEKLSALARPTPCYLVVWVADDGGRWMAIRRWMANSKAAGCCERGPWHLVRWAHAGLLRLSWPACALAPLARRSASPVFVCNRGGKCVSCFLDPRHARRTITPGGNRPSGR